MVLLLLLLACLYEKEPWDTILSSTLMLTDAAVSFLRNLGRRACPTHVATSLSLYISPNIYPPSPLPPPDTPIATLTHAAPIFFSIFPSGECGFAHWAGGVVSHRKNPGRGSCRHGRLAVQTQDGEMALFLFLSLPLLLLLLPLSVGWCLFCCVCVQYVAGGQIGGAVAPVPVAVVLLLFYGQSMLSLLPLCCYD